jgi:RNA polymerase sigma factor (sigma-70 family)
MRTKNKELLTKEEELNLFKIARDENRSKIERSKAEDTLVLKNMGLVLKEARRYVTNGSIPMEDLIQEGSQGLVRAIQKFDPSSDNKFSTYATWWIKRDIGRMIRTKSSVVHVPEHIAEAARIVKANINKFENEYGREPTDEEFEKVVCMPREKAEEAIQAIQKTTSIHTPVGDDNGTEFGDLIEDQKTNGPDDELAMSEGCNILTRALSNLTLEEQTMLAIRYGVISKPMSLKDIAKVFNIPEDKIKK